MGPSGLMERSLPRLRYVYFMVVEELNAVSEPCFFFVYQTPSKPFDTNIDAPTPYLFLPRFRTQALLCLFTRQFVQAAALKWCACADGPCSSAT